MRRWPVVSVDETGGMRESATNVTARASMTGLPITDGMRRTLSDFRQSLGS